MRIESLVPLKSLEILLENRSASEPLGAAIRLFDEREVRRVLPPGATERFLLDRPGFKKVRGRCGYQLDLRAGGGTSAAAPGWRLRLRLR